MGKLLLVPLLAGYNLKELHEPGYVQTSNGSFSGKMDGLARHDRRKGGRSDISR